MINNFTFGNKIEIAHETKHVLNSFHSNLHTICEIVSNIKNKSSHSIIRIVIESNNSLSKFSHVTLVFVIAIYDSFMELKAKRFYNPSMPIANL